MTSFLFLLGAVVAAMVLSSIIKTAKTKTFLRKYVGAKHLPQTISMLIVTAQISELVKVVEHTSIVSVTAALFLLVMLIATKSGTEGETH